MIKIRAYLGSLGQTSKKSKISEFNKTYFLFLNEFILKSNFFRWLTKLKIRLSNCVRILEQNKNSELLKKIKNGSKAHYSLKIV